MTINAPYPGPQALPRRIPVFPLTGAILLPRAQMPLNIFEPRYLAMIEDAMRGDRLIGMIQPDAASPATARGPALYRVGGAGRITQYAETGDGRLLISLHGVARFRIVAEAAVDTPYRQCEVDFADFAADFDAQETVEPDRERIVSTLRRFAQARRMCVDWSGIDETPTETLVNALAMMSPFAAAEKQAFLEAPSLQARADMLVAATEMDLAAPAGKASLQ